MTKQPTWCYQLVDIQNLGLIQSELLLVSEFIIKDIDNLVPNFHYIPRDQIESMVPATKRYLEDLGLLDRWKYLALITGNRGSSLPMHVDTLDWTTRSYGLNIPVLNCQGSFTVFYRAEISEPAQPDSSDPRSSAYYCNANSAVEIDRIESTNPCWINICVPHRPEVIHSLPRILASLRFSPEVHDFLINN